MLVTLNEILSKADKEGYGVGLFNMLNLEMARGIIEAAEEERSPLILGIAEVHLPYIPMEYAAPIMRKIANDATVPVCLHFDHGVTLENIQKAIDNGFSSVMFDGSALPYEENIAGTKQVVELAHAKGLTVEAELGHVGQADREEDLLSSAYTEVEQVNDFIDKTGCDALAVAIGTAHGKYVRKPVLDLNRLADIYAVSKRPLVLHGGSGLSDDDFRNTVKGGIRKVNICTDMCVAALNAYKAAAVFEPSVNEAKDAVKQVVQTKMRLFGSSGKA